MKKILFVLLLSAGCAGLTYKPVLRDMPVAKLLETLRREPDIRKRWQSAGNFYRSLRERPAPVLENGLLHFFYWDQTGLERVSLVLERDDWLPGRRPFRRLCGTPLLHCSVALPGPEPVRYMIQAGSRWYTDPNNPELRDDGAGSSVSYWHRPPADWPAWLREPQSARRGRISLLRITSRLTTAPVRLLLYRPSGAPARRLFLVFDDFADQDAVFYRIMLDGVFRGLSYPSVAVAVVDAQPARALYAVQGNNLTDLLEKELLVRIRAEGALAGTNQRPGLGLSGVEAGQLLTLMAGGEGDFAPLVLRQPELRYYTGYMNYYLRRWSSRAAQAPPVLVLTNEKPPAGLPEVVKQLAQAAPSVAVRAVSPYAGTNGSLLRRLDMTRELVRWLAAGAVAGSFPERLQ